MNKTKSQFLREYDSLITEFEQCLKEYNTIKNHIDTLKKQQNKNDKSFNEELNENLKLLELYNQKFLKLNLQIKQLKNNKL